MEFLRVFCCSYHIMIPRSKGHASYAGMKKYEFGTRRYHSAKKLRRTLIMKKKILSLLLLLSLAVSGCGNQNVENTILEDVSTTTQGQEEKGLNENSGVETSNKEPEKTYTPPEMKGELTISILDEMSILEAGAQMFMDKYPDVKIDIHTFRTLETIKLEGGAEMSGIASEEKSTENYLNQLNTRIISGNAEDIILSSGIPMQKYVSMGAFEELSFYMDHSPEINEENYYMNLFEAAGMNSKQMYSLPLATSIQTLHFDKALVEDYGQYLPDDMKNMSYSKALDYALELVENTNRKNTFLSISSGYGVVGSIVNEQWAKFVNEETKQAFFDTEEYIQLLHKGAEFEEKGYFDTTGLDFYNMEYYFAMQDDFDTQAAFYGLMDDSPYYHTMPLSDGDGNVPMSAYMQFGINSASPNKELAWEFLKFMISDEVQTSPSLYGMSVNRNGLDAYLNRQIANFNEGNKTKIDETSYKNLLKGWMEQVNVDHSSRQIIISMMYEENKEFFDGKQSAADTAKKLQAKVNKYFNE